MKVNGNILDQVIKLIWIELVRIGIIYIWIEFDLIELKKNNCEHLWYVTISETKIFEALIVIKCKKYKTKNYVIGIFIIPV